MLLWGTGWGGWGWSRSFSLQERARSACAHAERACSYLCTSGRALKLHLPIKRNLQSRTNVTFAALLAMLAPLDQQNQETNFGQALEPARKTINYE
jgi:hypothetical protein